MDNKNYIFNLIGLSETILELNNNKIKNNIILIELIRNNKIIEEIKISKNDLTKTLLDIFETKISSIENIRLNIFINGIKEFLTEINILN